MARAVFGAIEHDERQLGTQCGQEMSVGEWMIEIGKGIEYCDAVTPEAAFQIMEKIARDQIVGHAVALEHIDDHHFIAAVTRAHEGARVGFVHVHFGGIQTKYLGCRA